MKRIFSMVVVAAVMLSLLATAAFATDGSQTITFSGDGDWLSTDTKVDNTKSYTISYDLDFNAISSASGTDVWCDDTALKIRDVVADHYITFQVQAYLNGNGKYQIYSRFHFWDGSGWTEPDRWSADMDAPATKLSVRITWDAATATYTMVVTNREDGTELSNFSIDVSALSTSFKACVDTQVEFYRNEHSIVPGTPGIAYAAEPEPEPEPEPGDAFDGWETDEIDGKKDFSGWSTEDGIHFTVNYDETVGNHRIWKDLIEDPNEFSIDLTVTGTNATSVYVKLFGVTLELDSNGGNGDQTFIKLDGESYDWLAAEGCQVDVNISRTNGGDLQFTVTGKGNTEPLELTKAVAEDNENLELGLYRGQAQIALAGMENPATGDTLLFVPVLLVMGVLALAVLVLARKKYTF